MKKTVIIIVGIAVCLGMGLVYAQRYYDRGRYDFRGGVPEWEVEREFVDDIFTFVRIRYSTGYDGYGYGGYGRRGRGGGRWATDYPDSDLNFSFRLQQLTSMEVNPNGLILELTDPKLFDYPFIYIVEPGALAFTIPEVEKLREYLLNGGFLMVDDFWGEEEWWNFYLQMKRVFPDREPVEVPLSHPIFHCVFDLKERPQIPSINVALAGRDAGITWEREDAREVHYKAYYDDKGRMMAFVCHNTDLGDGWEREGENEWYFHEFSEKKAYPLGINIIFYATTH